MVSLIFAAMNPDVCIVQAEKNPSLIAYYDILIFTSCGKMSMLFRGLGPQSQVDRERL